MCAGLIFEDEAGVVLAGTPACTGAGGAGTAAGAPPNMGGRGGADGACMLCIVGGAIVPGGIMGRPPGGPMGGVAICTPGGAMGGAAPGIGGAVMC